MTARAPGRPLLLDSALAGVATAVLATAIATSSQASAGAFVFAVGFGAIAFVRRAQPVLSVAVSCLGLVAYYALGFPGIGLAIPVAVAMFSAAEAGRLWAAVIGSIGLLSYTYGYRWSVGQDPAVMFGSELAVNVAIMALAIVVGDGQRTRRRLLAEQADAARRAQLEQEATAARRVLDERLRISRDLHDAVGHSVVGLSLQADVAIEALDAGDAAAARVSMALVRASAGEAMRELRASVGLLREPGTGLADIEPLLALARAAGLQVSVDLHIPRAVPRLVDTAVYRILQESLSNVVQHTSADRVSIAVRSDDDKLEVRVRDNGEPHPATTGGHGLTSMRERAGALGGTLVAGHVARPAGFEVAATIPLPS